MRGLVALALLALAHSAANSSCILAPDVDFSPVLTTLMVTCPASTTGASRQPSAVTAVLAPDSETPETTIGTVSIVDLNHGIVGVTLTLDKLPSYVDEGKIKVHDSSDCLALGPSLPWMVNWHSGTMQRATGFQAVSVDRTADSLSGFAVAVYGDYDQLLACGHLTATGSYLSRGGSSSGSASIYPAPSSTPTESSSDSGNTWYYVAIVVVCVLGSAACVLGGLWVFLFRRQAAEQLRAQKIREGKAQVDSIDSARTSGTGFSRANTREFRGGAGGGGSGGRDSMRSGVSVRLSDADNMLDSCEGVVVVDHSVCTTVRTLPPRPMVGTAPAERISQTKKYAQMRSRPTTDDC